MAFQNIPIVPYGKNPGASALLSSLDSLGGVKAVVQLEKPNKKCPTDPPPQFLESKGKIYFVSGPEQEELSVPLMTEHKTDCQSGLERRSSYPGPWVMFVEIVI